MKLRGEVYFKDQLSGSIEKKEDGSFIFVYEENAPLEIQGEPNKGPCVFSY
jgi:hypothetical protein